MKWNIEERQEFLKTLSVIDRILVAGYRVLLGLIVVAVIGVVALVIMHRPWGDGNQGEWFYFSVVVLFVLCWAVGQFVMLYRRQRRRRSLATFHANSSSTENGGRTWELRFGPAAGDAQQAQPSSGNTQFGFSRKFEIPLATLPVEVLPNDEALVCLEAEMKRGMSLDEACRLIQPAFADWSERQRQAYRRYVTSMVNDLASTGPME